MLTANISATALAIGANSVTFELTNGNGGTSIFYDVIKLESD